MPTKQQIHIDRALTNMSVAWMQDANMFIADKVFPMVPVQKQSDVYFEYSRADFYRDEASERAPGTESAGGEYTITQADPYYCRRWAYHKDITEEERVNADTPLKPNEDATDFVTHKLLIRREVNWAESFFKTGVWTTELQGVGSNPGAGETLQWDQVASDPIKVITDECVRIASVTGYKPNTLVLSPFVYNALKNHEDFLDRIKHTQTGYVTADIMASLLDLDRVLVAWAVQNTGVKEGTESTDFILGKHALLCYVNPRPAIKKPSAGYIFAWRGLKGSGAYGNRIVRIPMPWLGMDTERIEGEMAFDTRVIAADLATFFKDIVG